ncbi:hypothetical protein LBC_00340 [Campylobacter sp. 19-13652]|nr:hypothetical protein LBC_00340 [Campylobacter sp. 19-13652]
MVASLRSAKPADNPKDTQIKVVTDSSEHLCYTPTFTKGEGYIYLDYCNSPSPSRARYDLFGRIIYQLNGNELCLTAPSSVTGIGTSAYNSWDYITLRPCVINDLNQQWIIKDSSIYTKDARFRIKSYKYYAYISKNDADGANHKLESSMNEWANTVASPGSITVKTPVFWHYFSYPSGWRPYFLMDNKSTTEQLIELYYNTQNGHIAQYHPEDGSLRCLVSNHKKGQSWNWAGWVECKDTTSKEDYNALYWSVDIGNENDYMLRDYWGDILRVTKYGSN